MGSIPENSVVFNCLEQLGLGEQRDVKLDRRVSKLTSARLAKLIIEAVLNKRDSYSMITLNLQSSEEMQKVIGLSSISASQISRRLRKLPYTFAQKLFVHMTGLLQEATKNYNGLPGLGRLHVIDSTSISLPEVAGKWAYVSKSKNAVKMHTRLVVADRDTVYPDKIIASTAGVADSDSEVVLKLVTDPDAIYVFDRGYIVYGNYRTWVEQSLRFVARLQARNRTVILMERDIPNGSPVVRDANVKISFNKDGETFETEHRLVEFLDEKGRLYRLLTNVYDLTAEQISEIYRHRWMIELFFKWIKGHLKLVKLYSCDKEAVWSQMYFALTAFALIQWIKLQTGAKQTAWDILKYVRNYASKTWQEFVDALFRPPGRTSKGRRKKPKRGRPRKHPKKYEVAREIAY